MTSLFCRHNRMTANCPICSKELEAELRAKAPPRPAGRARAAAPGTRRRASAQRGSGSLVTRRLARAADDGYRNRLVPGLRATADAERLAAAMMIGAERLEPPGPYEEVATEPDVERAAWLAFLLALAGPGDPERQAAVLAGPPPSAPSPTPWREHARTIAAYATWAERAGSQEAGLTGEPDWSPAAPLRPRLRAPRPARLHRAARFELLVTLGASGRFALVPDQLELGAEGDPATTAAKRILQSGDRMLLERRARDLAAACAVPLAALDRALALWGDPDGGDRRGRGAPGRHALRPGAAVSGALRPRASRGRGIDLSWCSAALRWPRSRICSPPPRPTTPGRGSSGAARSCRARSTRGPGRRGSRCRCCSRPRSR